MTQLHSVASLDYGDGRTCICRICECGKHPCPGVKVPFVGETTYRDEYVPKKVDPDRSKRNHNQVFNTKAEPGHFKTTKQEAAEALAGKKIAPAESYKPRQDYVEPLPFEGTSTNRADFPGHIPDVQRARRKQEPLPKLKGLYDTTYRTMVDPMQKAMDSGKMPEAAKPFRGDEAPRQELPFDGISSYTAEYPAKEVPYVSAGPRKQGPSNVPENRDFTTTQMDAFKVPPANMRHVCPASLAPIRPPSVDGHVKLSVYNIPSGDVFY